VKQLLNFRVSFLKLAMKLIDFLRLLGRQRGLRVVRYKINGRCLESNDCPWNVVMNVLQIKVNIFKQGNFRI
jgi:hypothetical protein